MPMQDIINKLKYHERRRTHFAAGTCFDQVVTKQLQERLPQSVSFLRPKDLQPPVVETDEIKKLKRTNLLARISNESYLQDAKALTNQL